MKKYIEPLLSRPFLIIACIHILAIIITAQINDYMGLNSEYDEYHPNNPMSQAGIEEGDTENFYGKIYDIRHKSSEDGETNIFILSDVYWQGKLLTTPGKYIQAYVDDVTNAKIGSIICVRGRIDYYDHSRNQGEFDSYRFYRNRGYLFCVRDGTIIEFSNTYSRLSQKMYEIKRLCESRIDYCFGKEDGSVIKAMLLGVKEELDSDTKELFQRSGVAHILAISGLHISFLCMAVYKLFINAGVPFGISILGSEIILFLYVLMVGFSPSAFRASIMFSLFLIAKIMKRSYDMISAMSVSAIVILLINPGYLYDASFQLSFLAILSVGFFYPNFINNTRYLMTFLKKRPSDTAKGRIYNFFVSGGLGSLLTSFWVYMVSLPVLLSCYFETAIYAILLNIVVIPLLPVLLVGAIGTLILTNRVNAFAKLFCLLVKSTLNFYKKSCLFLEKSGVARVNLGKPAVWAIGVFYLVLVLICLYKGRKRLLIQTLGLILCMMLMAVKVGIGSSLYMLDVGQGDSIVYVNDNRNVYIFDSGSSSKKNIGKKKLIPFLKYHGISQIEAVFLSHADEDHINGILELLDYMNEECINIKHIYVYSQSLENGDYADILEKAKKRGVEISGIGSCYELVDKEMKIRCIYPSQNAYIDSANNSSLVLRLEYGEFSFLETGDAELNAETTILEENNMEQVDILKVAHHGSSSSSGEEFISKAKPQYALISAGRNNRYGHPHAETIEVLTKNNSKIIQTAQSGQITVKIGPNGSKYSIYTYVK